VRRGVKSRLFRRPPGWAGWLAAALSIGAGWSPASAAEREAPFLLGGGKPIHQRPVETDPWLPTGAPVEDGIERPSDAEAPACSFRAPVCVHRGSGVGADAARAALAALEVAHARLVRVLGLPPPRADHGAGGSDALDLYLTATPGGDLVVGSEPDVLGDFDRAAGFCVLGETGPSLLERAATLCLGESIALGLDPAETPFLRRAFAEHLWLSTGRVTSLDFESFDTLQAHPELPPAARDRSPLSEAGALLFEYLDDRRGFGDAGDLATGLFSVSVGKTAPRSWLWDNWPDVFDVLRRNLDDDPRAIAKLFLDLAVTRAFLGERDDGTHLPRMEWLGAFGRPRFDWEVTFSSLPRHVAATRAIGPHGSFYLWLGLDRVPDGAELGFQAKWEAPVAFAWSLVRVGAHGEELGRLDAPFIQRGNEVQQNLVDLKDAAGILVVGTNLGGTDLKHPFDPDREPFEPHGCTVYLAKL